MSLYVRLYTSFFSHRKTLRLRRLIGDAAYWVPPRLWAYAAVHQPDGDFGKYVSEDIAYAIGYGSDSLEPPEPDAKGMIQALIDSGFLDPDMKLHDWLEHSGFHQLYAAKEKAKKAANARWEKERNRKKDAELSRTEAEAELKGALLPHCTSNANAMPEHCTSNASSIRASGRKPASVEEVITKGQFIGVSEQDCRDWFRDCEACAWTRGDGTPFDNWPRQLVIHRDKLAERKSKNGNNQKSSGKHFDRNAGTANEGRASQYNLQEIEKRRALRAAQQVQVAAPGATPNVPSS